MPTLIKKTHRPKRLTGVHKVERERDNSWRSGLSSTKRGYGYKWQKARAAYLKLNPLCVYCEKKGTIRLANVVDHIIDHEGDEELFWNEDNWQSLCTSCHNQKPKTRK